MTVIGTRWSGTTKRVVVLVVLVLFLYLLTQVGDIVKPFVWAAVFSFVLLPIVGILERRLRIRRSIAALAVFLALIATVFGLGRVLVPLAAAQYLDLRNRLPEIAANAQQTIADAMHSVGIDQSTDVIFVEGPQRIAQELGRLALPIALGAVELVFQMLLFLVATYFLLRDAPRLMEWVRSQIPAGHRREVVPLLAEVNSLLLRFVRGQLILIVYFWIVTTLVLTLLDVPYALLLGIATGLLKIIPIIGPFVAGAIACVVALGHPNPFDWSQFAYVGVVAVAYTILNNSDDYFIVPFVMGKILRLHPALVIFSSLAGGTLFGLLGILLALPTAATLRLVLVYVRAKLRDEDPYPALEHELTEPAQA